MSLPEIVSRAEWLEQRRSLLEEEKTMTRRRDALNAQRRRLPMVRLEVPYTFVGPDGEVTLRALFGSSIQLIVQHVMFDPSWEGACPGCTAAIGELAPGLLRHLESRNTAFVLISRAPYEKLAAYARSRSWFMPWYSSFGSSFNFDFHVSFDPAAAPVEYNYRDAEELERRGAGFLLEGPSEQPGFSCFLRDGDEIFHTYSTFARGTEGADGSYGLLDLTALGRQEEWEEPKGRAPIAHGADPSFTS